LAAARPPDILCAMPETIAAALQRAIARLAGTATPLSDAEELLGRLLGLRRSDLYLDSARRLGPADSTRLGRWLDRRVANEPVQYVTGRAAFRGLDLAVDARVLVPRPETEGLVELALAALRERAAAWPAPRVLDLGTGSGAIALAVAAEWPAAIVTATDASDDALAVARANAAALALGGRVCFRAGRWLEAVPGERFEVVVSNPPYVAEPEWTGLPPDVRDFEPRGALVSGPNGLDDIRAIAAAAPAALVPGGRLMLEVAEQRAHAIGAALGDEPAWTAVEVRRDLAGRPRYVLARRADAGEGGGR
jgi:release factor glutamine methyltransferase